LHQLFVLVVFGVDDGFVELVGLGDSGLKCLFKGLERALKIFDGL